MAWLNSLYSSKGYVSWTLVSLRVSIIVLSPPRKVTYLEKSGKPIERGIDATKEAAIWTAPANGNGILKTAREHRTGSSVAQHIKAVMVRANNTEA
jgi:hypothetical protein